MQTQTSRISQQETEGQESSALAQGVLVAKSGLGPLFIIPVLLILPLKDSNARFRLLLLILFSPCSRVCWEEYGF